MALEERVAHTDLSLTSFRRNFAVCEATVNGQTVHPKAFNDEESCTQSLCSCGTRDDGSAAEQHPGQPDLQRA